MPNFTVTIDGTDYDVDDAADEAEAQREALAHHEQERTQSTNEFLQQPYWDRVGQRGQDMARAAVSGVSFGLADRAAAGADTLFNGMSWDEANAKQERLRADAKARLDAGVSEAGRGTYEALEFGGGMLLPFKSVKVPGIALESGVRGGVSSYGHGEDDPMQIAKDAAINGIVGTLTAGAANAGRYAQKAAPFAADMVRRYGRSWWPTLTSVLHANPVATAATIATKLAAPKVATGIEQFAAGTPIDPENARRILSQLTTGVTRQQTDY